MQEEKEKLPWNTSLTCTPTSVNLYVLKSISEATQAFDPSPISPVQHSSDTLHVVSLFHRLISFFSSSDTLPHFFGDTPRTKPINLKKLAIWKPRGTRFKPNLASLFYCFIKSTIYLQFNRQKRRLNLKSSGASSNI